MPGMRLRLGLGLAPRSVAAATGLTLDVAPEVTGTLEVGETLSCTTGDWTGSGELSYGYQWQRDGVNISMATSSTYELVADDNGADIRCVVTATDDDGSKSANSNTVGPVLGAPINTVAPVISGTPAFGETLSCTTGTWVGVATITYAYQWKRDGEDIISATSSTYELDDNDYDTLITCEVTATNSFDSVAELSNSLGPVAGFVPIIDGVPTISGTETVGETLTATPATVDAVPESTTTWQWERSGTPIDGATSDTYELVEDDEGETITVVQTETNVEGSDSAESDPTGEISPEESSSPPSLVSTTVSNSGSSNAQTLSVAMPATVNAGDLLVCHFVSSRSQTQGTTPSGWTFVGLSQQGNAGTSSSLQHSLYYKVAAGTEGGTNVTFASSEATGQKLGIVHRLTGVDGTTPVPQNVLANGSSDTPSTAGVTTTTDNNLAMVFMAFRDTVANVSAEPSGYTTWTSQETVAANSFGVENRGGYKTQASAGATGSASWTLSASKAWVSATLSIKPA